MGGLLIPPWYQADLDTPSASSRWLVAFLFGFSTACGAFCLATIVHQSYRTWQRSNRLVTHPYIILITLEWTSSIVISVVSYLFLNSVIPPSFWLFFGILCLWVIQIQCLMQIIINRIALIMYDGRSVRKLKWIVTGLIGIINISVFIIWMPARLQISPTWVAINNVWDRVEKGLLALIDLGLNLKFIHLVHSELIRHGLTKYRDLYRFNLCMIFVSISLDIVLIGIMSLPHESSFVYVQFHPLMYLIKLEIELRMADLIVKIVRATSPPPDHELHRYAASSSPQVARPSQTRNNTDTSKGTSTSGATYNTTSGGETTLLQSPPPPTCFFPPPTSCLVTESPTKTTTTVNLGGGGRRASENHNHNLSSSNNNNHHHHHAQTSSLPWELKQMPTHFDVHDVVHPQIPEQELADLEKGSRKISIAEGSVRIHHTSGAEGLSGSPGNNNNSNNNNDNLLMAPVLTVRRPALGNRNFSELTQLELGVGYVAKEKRDTICREHGGDQL